MISRTKYNSIHRVLLSILMSLCSFLTIKFLIIDLTVLQYILIEILIGIGEFLTNFMRKSTGIQRPEITK
tara:strand:+ start:1709 stop:1918 length:210 start_codon:yes stop_codon:yes gene_type:complete